MSKERLNLAIVGLGKMGLLHASILNTLRNVRLVVLCEKSFFVRKFSEKILNEVDIVGDIGELSDFSLDAVYVTTPIPTHYFIVKYLYTKKITNNVFVEKTLASNYREAKIISDLAETSGGANMVGYMKRFAVTFRKARDLLNREILGELVSFDAYAYSSDFLGAAEGSRASQYRGGVLRDLGSHIIDLALFFFGNLQVCSSQLESIHGNDCEDSVCFTVQGPKSLKGKFQASWCMDNFRMPESGIKIRGSKGALSVDDYKVELELNSGASNRWYRHDLNDNVAFLLGEPEYFREDKYFIDSLLNNRNAEPSFSAASRVEYIIDQVKCGTRENDC